MSSLVLARGVATVFMAALVGMLVAGLGGGCGNNSLSIGAPADAAAPTAGIVRQLLEDPRAANGVGAFYRWWLDLPDLASTVRDPVLFRLSRLDPVPPGVTVRQQEESHLTASNCNACHSYIDPLGFAFEGFDAMGRARTTDNGQTVDVSDLSFPVPHGDDGTVTEGPIDGPIELAMLIAANPTAQDCMVRQWLSFALGRDLQDADSPTVADLDRLFAAANFNLKTLVSDVLLSDTFLSP